MEEYRGYTIFEQNGEIWIQSSTGIVVGPYDSVEEARQEIDKSLDE